MDVADVAAEFEERFRAHALAVAQALAPRGVAASECHDCGEPIPEDRRRAVPGTARCVDCQDVRERRRT